MNDDIEKETHDEKDDSMKQNNVVVLKEKMSEAVRKAIIRSKNRPW